MPSCRRALNSFRPTLVGSEGQHRIVIITLFESFRPTLVGSEVDPYHPLDYDENVSDQPSWGRRIHGARLRIGEMC